MNKSIIVIILFLAIGCSSKVSKETFLKQKVKFDKLYEMVRPLKFDCIHSSEVVKYPESDIKKAPEIFSLMDTLSVRIICRYENGIFFEVEDNFIGGDGYLKVEIPKDSVEYWPIMTFIEDGWYRWYQD
jgi:hypothetical protein